MDPIEITPPLNTKAPPRSSWGDLVLYVVVGFGTFLGAGVALRGILQHTSLLSSAVIYTLNIVCFSGTVALVGVAQGKLSWSEIGFWPVRWQWIWLPIAVGIVLVFNPIRIGLAVGIDYLLTGSLNDIQNSARTAIFAPGGFTWANFLVTLVMAGVLAPIAEELFFRGALYTWFRERYAVWIAVLASSALFALGHADTFAVVITSLVLGAVNALVYERTRSIWAPIAIHVVNNSTSVILVYLVMLLQPLLGGK
jgi:uncharacterized protein